MVARQTTNAPDKQKNVVWQSRSNYQIGQTNEDVVKGQPTIVPAKSRCDGTAIKKCTSKMRNGSTIMNKNGGKSKQHQLGD